MDVTRSSTQDLLIGISIKTNQEDPSLPQRRSAKLAGGTEEYAKQGFAVGFVLFQIEVDDLPSPRRIDLIDVADQLQDFLFQERGFLGVDFGLRFDGMLRKKLLRSFAGRSARSMKAPIKIHRILHYFPRR